MCKIIHILKHWLSLDNNIPMMSYGEEKMSNLTQFLTSKYAHICLKTTYLTGVTYTESTTTANTSEISLNF